MGNTTTEDTMNSKQILPSDADLVRELWSNRAELVNLHFTVRQQYLTTESRIFTKTAELDTQLESLVKQLREKNEVPENWRLDLAKGVFVGPPSEAPPSE